MPDGFEIGPIAADRGEKVWGRLPLVAGPDGVDVYAPVAIAHGRRSGPVVYIGAGTHGDELNGIECARRLAVSIDPQAVRGTVVIVPIHNVLSFLAKRRETPWDGLNVNRSFPGSADRWFTERMAHTLYTSAIQRADVIIDLHGAMTGGRCLTHIFTPLATPDAARRSVELATVFGPDLIIPMTRMEYEGFDLGHTLHVVAGNEGKPVLCVEIGEGSKLEEQDVQAGVVGSLRVLDALGVYAGDRELLAAPKVPLHTARDVVPIRCNSAGLMLPRVALGGQVRRGDLLATVVAIPDRTEEIRAPVDGLVFRLHTHGVCIPGDRIVQLATLA
jgi:uncharacterized protein